MLFVIFGAISFTMAHSSFSVDKQLYPFQFYPESDVIKETGECSSDSSLSEDAKVTSLSSFSCEGSERLDLEDPPPPFVPEVDQQIAEPTVSPTDNLMDTNMENMRVSSCCNSSGGSVAEFRKTTNISFIANNVYCMHVRIYCT